jgi:hypothetical protein
LQWCIALTISSSSANLHLDSSQSDTQSSPISHPNSGIDRLLNIQEIYDEPNVVKYSWGQEILDQYPDVNRIPVDLHWNIPDLHGNEGSVQDWNRIKRTVLV